MVHYTVGIAGHIDHGKTTLTKTLTGIDTDRLKEEKERNISIETGFAHFQLPSGHTVGIVDVPGHERFIRQMISGVAGIDLVLLLIAADEGVMPQTREHLDILNLLGIKKGVIVVSKVDLVEEEFRDLVIDEIKETVKDTFLEYAPIVSVSSKTGEGIEELKHLMEFSLANIPGKAYHEPLRLPIDRVFTIKGSGTVVTGTIYEGQVKIGDQLRLLPQDLPVRVRQIQVHHKEADVAYAGQRTALNITGIEHHQIARGNVLVAYDFLEATQRIDLYLQVLPTIETCIKHRSRVHVYTNTSEVEGLLIFFGQEEVLPGERVYAQVILHEPVVVKRNDPILLRRPTPALTIGGGRVINPYGRKYRFHPDTVHHLQRMHHASIKDQILLTLLEGDQTVLEVMKQTTIPYIQLEPELRSLIEEKQVIQISLPGLDLQTLLAHPENIEGYRRRILTVLEEYHKSFPSQIGMKRSELKERMVGIKPETFAWLMDDLIQKETIHYHGERVSLSSFRPHLPEDLEEKANMILSILTAEGREVSDWSVLVSKVGLNQKQGDEIRQFLQAAGKIINVDEKWSWRRDVWELSLQKLREHCKDDTVSIADVKELFGLSRKYAIPFLEKLDAEGITIRKGDQRFWK